MSSEYYDIYRTGKVVDGELQGISWKSITQELPYFNDLAVELIIRRKKKHRSTQQNRVQWWYIQEIKKRTGYTTQEVYGILCKEFLTVTVVNEDTGNIFERVRGTSELSTIEHAEFTENIRRFAAEQFDLYLPEPNEQTNLNI